MKRIAIGISIVLLIVILSISTGIFVKGNGSVEDISNFTKSKACLLALSVKHQNTWGIKLIGAISPSILNYQDEVNGATLLSWAVGKDKYKSVKALLESGANPNIPIKSSNETPLFIASSYLWDDTQFDEDPKYVTLLLEYGADPDICYVGERRYDGSKNLTEEGTSPLMNSIGCGIEKTKALVEAGANINLKTVNGETAALYALKIADLNNSVESFQYADVIIVTKKASVIDEYYYYEEDIKYTKRAVSILRDMILPLDSPEYKIKMRIVEEFKRQGIDYFSEPIDEFNLKLIKEKYPTTWQEYIKKY